MFLYRHAGKLVNELNSLLVCKDHRLNIEVDLQSLSSMSHDVHSCTHWLRPRNPLPSPRIGSRIRGRYWSAKIDDISLWPIGEDGCMVTVQQVQCICVTLTPNPKSLTGG